MYYYSVSCHLLIFLPFTNVTGRGRPRKIFTLERLSKGSREKCEKLFSNGFGILWQAGMEFVVFRLGGF